VLYVRRIEGDAVVLLGRSSQMPTRTQPMTVELAKDAGGDPRVRQDACLRFMIASTTATDAAAERMIAEHGSRREGVRLRKTHCSIGQVGGARLLSVGS